MRFARPEHHPEQHPLARLGEAPGDQDALLGPVWADREEDRVAEQRGEPDLVEVAALKVSKRSRSSWQLRAAVDFDSFPNPALSQSDSTSRIDSPCTNAPITIAFQRLRAQQLGAARNSFETNGSAASRTCGIST